MTRILLSLALFLFGVHSFAQVHVKGYYRRNGTYVQPHERTRPNHTITDNYSYPGNYNPNTGRITGGSTNTRSSVVQNSNEVENYQTTPATKIREESHSLQVKMNPDSDLSVNKALTSVQLYAETESNAALKIRPSYTANSTYAIPSGSVVKVSKYDDNYFYAEVNGLYGYVCTCQVKKTFNRP